MSYWVGGEIFRPRIDKSIPNKVLLLHIKSFIDQCRSVGLVVREIFKSLFFHYVFIIDAKKYLEFCLNKAGRALSTYLGLAERHVGHTNRVEIMSSN